MGKYAKALASLSLLLLTVSVVITQLAKPEPRNLEWVALRDTTYQEVSFRNTAQNIQLAGMLFVPEGEGPFPAAVIIHGSGSSRRDSGWYLTLTQYLQDTGVVVLLPDKRGSERSGGDWRTASYHDLATDTVAAVEFLKRQNRVDVSGIGIIGMSEGGRIAPVVADQAPDIAYMVDLVGGAVPAHEALVYEENHNLREMGILPGFSDLLAYPAAWSLIYSRRREFWSAVGNFDPAPFWQETPVPSLVLYGEDDTNVPSHRSAEILRSLGNPNIDVRIYEGSGHALESPPGEGRSIIREDALREIRGFIRSVATEQ